MKYHLYDRVVVNRTNDPELDGQKAEVIGFYGDFQCIIKFDDSVTGYNPAIVIVQECLDPAVNF